MATKKQFAAGVSEKEALSLNWRDSFSGVFLLKDGI
jgi:hypothetical protein